MFQALTLPSPRGEGAEPRPLPAGERFQDRLLLRAGRDDRAQQHFKQATPGFVAAGGAGGSSAKAIGRRKGRPVTGEVCARRCGATDTPTRSVWLTAAPAPEGTAPVPAETPAPRGIAGGGKQKTVLIVVSIDGPFIDFA